MMEVLSPNPKAAKRLATIKAGRKCNRLPVDATKAEIRDAHRAKMALKKAARTPQPVDVAPVAKPARKSRAKKVAA